MRWIIFLFWESLEKRGKSKDEEIIEKEDGDSDDSSSEDNEDFNELPEQPDFLGCEYLHISYSKNMQ